MPQISYSKAILFADISGSSALYKNVGNQNAKQIVDFVLTALSQLVIDNHGEIVKNIGDEIMTCFDDTHSCMLVANTMQRQFSHLVQKPDLALSIGIGFGDVIIDNNDLFGEAVNDAAYLTHLAQGGQVLLSESVFEKLDESIMRNTQEFDRVVIKGANSESIIYRYFWQDDKIKENITDSETRLMSVDKVLSGITSEQIQLTYKGIHYLIRSEDTPYYIGRDEMKCDLKVQADQVSREHCRINFSRGKFVLVDHSTNGCYVKSVDKDEMYIRREEYPLLNNTTLSLGVRIGEDNHDIIEITLNN